MKSQNSTALLFLVLEYTVRTNAAFTATTFSSTQTGRCQTCTSSPTALFTGKDSDRARTERDLEDMMGNDWRLFRARLVAEEHAEDEDKNSESPSAKWNVVDEKQKRQENMGNFFAGAISSIFHNKNEDNHGHEGGGSFFLEEGIEFLGLPPVEDPFASQAEIIASVLKPKVDISKHRWAHPISHIEPGCVLIANEKLGGIFHQTVVLIIDHHEATGSTGIVINRPFPDNLLKVASETVSNLDLSLKLAFNSAVVSYGGPVMQEDYSILHGYGEVEGAKKVAPGIFVGGSRELMHEVRKNNFKPADALFVKGHAAWVPSQLNREISKGVWYIASASPDLILRYAGAPIREGDNPDDLWSDILACMDGKYKELATKYAGKGDLRMMP